MITMKGLKILAALAATAFAFGACTTGMGSDEEVTPPQPDRLKLSVFPSNITADGEQAAAFTVTYGDTELTAADVTFYDAEDQAVEMPELTFSTTQVGTYTFYAKYTPADAEEVKSNTVSVTATDPTAEPDIPDVDLSTKDETGLSVTPTATVFQAGVESVVLVVRYDGKVVAEGYSFFDASDNKPLKFPTVNVKDDDGTAYDLPLYTATEPGTLSFWASYRTANTAKNPTKLTAVAYPVPQRPTDTQPDNTSFKRRTLLLQITGTTCGFCPYMIAALEDVFSDSAYADKAVLAAAHTYNTSDPCYIAGNIGQTFGLEGAPYVVADMQTSFTNNGYSVNMKLIKDAINKSQETAAQAGISVNMRLSDRILVARVAVKAAEANDFRVGAWLLENGIVATQSNYGMKGDYDFNTHNHAIRVLDSRNGGNYSGHSLGHLSKGEVVDYLFVITLDPKWVDENCQMVFFVTSASGSSYTVTNAIITEGMNATLNYDYK